VTSEASKPLKSSPPSAAHPDAGLASGAGAPNGDRASTAPKAGSKKKKKSLSELQDELRALSRKPSSQAARPAPFDMRKILVRGGAVIAVVWVVALIVRHWSGYVAAGVLTVGAIAAVIWLKRHMAKTMALGSILRSADDEQGRKAALERIDSEFKKNDTQAVIAKAQLQMQDDPRAALATLEKVNLERELPPVAGQVRAMRAMIHLSLGEVQPARSLVDKLELGKQQEPSTRVLFAAVASEAWARTGDGRKAVDTMELFNPDADDVGELRAQLYRSRAFAYAAVNDSKGVSRSLKKLADINPHLLGMFVGQKKVHPLLEREAKNLVMRMGVAPRKVVRQRM